MNYRLPRQIVGSKILEFISKEIKRQKLPVTRASNNRLKEIIAVSRSIKQRGIPKHLVCKKLPHKLGRGIFLRLDAKPILRHQLIAPYSGEVSIVPENKEDDTAYAFSVVSDFHLTKEQQTLFDSNNFYHPRRLYSLKLDALKKGNFTRFINHSETPNLIACAFLIPSKNSYGLAPAPIEIFYVAKKTIQPGEQLLVCYEEEEKSYWGAINIKPFPMTPKTFQLTNPSSNS